MADPDLKRIDVGFDGGQVLELRVTEDVYGDLRKSLEKGSDGWHLIKTQDSEVAVHLGEIVYVRVETERHKVGF